MSKISVYTREAFGGRAVNLNHDVRDLEQEGFNNAIASLKVIGEPWVAYYDKNFAGKQLMFEAGEYATLAVDRGKFSSLKMVSDDLANPEIQLFEFINYQGRTVTLRNEANLPNILFSDKASSHKVISGVWILYDGINRKGDQLIAFPGDQVPNYGPLNFDNKASSVRPLLPRP
ncbi:hypothetical protein PO909_029946 [Leuciscus waleckii]